MTLKSRRAIYKAMRVFTRYLAIAAVMGLSMCWAQERPLSISILNYSFEYPIVTAPSARIDAWTKLPKPANYDESTGTPWDALTTIFPNGSSNSSNFLAGLGLTQAAQIGNVAGNGFSQTLSNLYGPGKYYLLSARHLGGGGGMPEGASFRISLQYQSGAQRIEIAGQTATFQKDIFSANHWMKASDFFSPTVASDDSWAGQQILLRIEVVSSAANEGGFWVVDDLRLTEFDPLYIPGPGDIATDVAINVELRGNKTRLWWFAPSQWQFQLQRSVDLKTWQDYGSLRYGEETDLYQDVPADESTNAFFILSWSNQPRP